MKRNNGVLECWSVGVLEALCFLITPLLLHSITPSASAFTPGPQSAAFLGSNKRRPPEDITTDLRAYWSFDTATVSGSSVADLTTNANTLTLHNSPTIVAGHLNEAVSFASASSQWADAASSLSLMMSNSEITVSFWIKLLAFPGAGKYPMIVAKGHPNSGFVGGYFNGDDLKVYSGVGTGGSDAYCSTGYTLPTNAWHHIALTQTNWNGQAMTIYVDGATNCTIANVANLENNSDLLTIARHYSNPAAYGYLDAIVDEVRIYGRPLTPAQIATLAAQ